MKHIFLGIILFLVLIIFFQFVSVERKKDAIVKVRLIKNTLRYNVEHKIQSDVNLTTYGRSVSAINKWIKYF